MTNTDSVCMSKDLESDRVHYTDETVEYVSDDLGPPLSWGNLFRSLIFSDSATRDPSFKPVPKVFFSSCLRLLFLFDCRRL